jgi:predicted transposase YbfD/YdcC
MRLFPPRETVARQEDLQTATTHEKGHGRLETRTLETLTQVPPWLSWPGAQQICRITRQRTIKGTTSLEIVLAITSLTRLRANAERLLGLSRQHWSIENRLHYVRDVSMGEDACRVRSGHAPQLLAALRNMALGLIRRRTRHKFIPDAIRRFIAEPFAALALILPMSEGDN